MPLICLIGFPDDAASDLTAFLAERGCEIHRQKAFDEAQAVDAIFVCADTPGWLETICHARAIHKRTLRLPDHEKWLDALEAGANDYFSRSLDSQQFEWLLRRRPQSQPAEKALAKAAS